MINYDWIEDTVEDAISEARSMGFPYNSIFIEAAEQILEGVYREYDREGFEDLLRYLRNNHFGRARGEAKPMLDNLLYHVLDIVSFGR